MSEMVERVTDALIEMAPHNVFGDLPMNIPGTLTEDDYREHYRFLARAAIATMREPTKAMLDAVYDSFDSKNFRMDRQPLLGEWQAMIDEALK